MLIINYILIRLVLLAMLAMIINLTTRLEILLGSERLRVNLSTCRARLNGSEA